MNKLDLQNLWHSSGINRGDCVLLHSNVKGLSRKLIKSGDKKPLDSILDSFIDVVGDDGTLVIPIFNFDFTAGTTFDALNTPSQMGSLTENARLRCKGKRSGHPVYSFCAFGKYADKIHSINNQSAYSDDSPFGFLRSINGKIASLDLEDQESMTFYHHVEEICKVNYRFMKYFTSDYIDVNGTKASKSYSIYVRDVEHGVLTHVNPVGEEMWNKGIYRGDRPGINSGLRTAFANDIFEFVESIIVSGRAEGLLFRYQ